MSNLPEVHDEKPRVMIGLDAVGIRGLKTRIALCRSNCIEYPIILYMYVDLPDSMRGVHVSRFIDALDKVRKNRYDSVIGFLRELARELLVRHNYSKQVVIEAETLLYTNEYNGVNTRYGVKASRDGDHREYLVIEIAGLTTCPCARELYSFVEKIPAENSPTHMQRTKLIVRIAGNRIEVDPIVLVENLENVFSNKLEPRLKRLDEYELIRDAIRNPKFVEDVVRDAVAILSSMLDRNYWVSIRAISEESIHPYDIEAIIEGELDTLRRILRKESS
ncbi:MAG: GTP cyclohydrolase, FolE2/MptA family [Thermoprotei archaeon]